MPVTVAGLAAKQFERVLREESSARAKKDTASTTYASIFKNAKDLGANTPAIKMAVRLLKMEPQERNGCLTALIQSLLHADTQMDLFAVSHVRAVILAALGSNGEPIVVPTEATDQDDESLPFDGDEDDDLVDDDEEGGEDGEEAGALPDTEEEDAAEPDIGEVIPEEHDPALGMAGAYFNEGAAIASRGGILNDCPHPEGSTPAKLWIQGFMSAKPTPVVVPLFDEDGDEQEDDAVDHLHPDAA